MTDDPIATPTDTKTRIMKTGDAGFVVACACGADTLEDADERPHETPDQFVNIDANAPSSTEWLRLEEAAEGWYAADPWTPPESYIGTRAQRRQRVRERVREIADEVACPTCGANAGRKCQRPSGHRVRSAHADRVDAAREAGILESEGDGESEEESE
ncbi:zinc finger domain-containing protein [Natrinema salsiterrestre]|uniref:DNA-binding phage zinc finger domain-containing protein n=1 Tax=Natrinema salsiterrestre TaxID=2950540 RepID=A0A9Q4Q3S8_9EURY|nr:hypothetical protein [Natrinema salsiterrestre]MDF9747871.1 hypothetical protein [Natrinema salsiterrestre]